MEEPESEVVWPEPREDPPEEPTEPWALLKELKERRDDADAQSDTQS